MNLLFLAGWRAKTVQVNIVTRVLVTLLQNKRGMSAFGVKRTFKLVNIKILKDRFRGIADEISARTHDSKGPESANCGHLAHTVDELDVPSHVFVHCFHIGLE